MPTLAEYKQAITEFREHPTLSEVKLFTATNEPNEDMSTATEDGRSVTSKGGITVKPSAQTAGKYWRKFAKLCEPSEQEINEAEERKEKVKWKCLVGAGDFADRAMKDTNNGTSRGHAYFEAYKNAMGAPQKVAFWAWHAYADGQEIGDSKDHLWGRPKRWWSRFDQFRKAVNRVTSHHPSIWGGPAHIWLTEQGVRFEEKNKLLPAYRNGAVARAIMRAYVDGLSSLVGQSSRIKRFYYYEMRGEPDVTQQEERQKEEVEGRFFFDSGLLLPPAKWETEHSSEKPAARYIYRIYKWKTNK